MSSSHRNDLQLALQAAYGSNSIPVHPSSVLLNGLKSHSLYLFDLDVSDAEIQPLCRFLASRQAIEQLQIVSLSRCGVGQAKTFRHKRKIFRGQVVNSAFAAYNQRLLRAVFEFIRVAQSLHSFLMDTIDVGLEMFFALGRCLPSASALRWLSIKNVVVEDKGIRLMTHALSTLTLQVLILENCGLTDDSCKYLSAIIKTQAAQLDIKFWNNTLRRNPRMAEFESTGFETETKDYYNGLLLLSVKGNAIQGSGLELLARVLRNNTWLIGLDLADNKIDAASAIQFLKELTACDFLRIILLHGNPGFDEKSGKLLKRLVSKPISEHFNDLPEDFIKILLRWNDAQESKLVGHEDHDEHGIQADIPLDLSSESDVSGDRIEERESDGLHSDIRDVKRIARRLKNARETVQEFDQRYGMEQSQRQQRSRARVDVNEEDSEDALDLCSDDDDDNRDEERNDDSSYTEREDYHPISPHIGEFTVDGERPPSRQSLRPQHLGLVVSAPASVVSGNNLSMNASVISRQSKANGSLITKSSESPRSAKASKAKLDRSEFLLSGGGLSPSHAAAHARDSVWSPSGHESRLSLNPRAGEVLQDLLSRTHRQVIRKKQIEYYDSVSSPKASQKPSSGKVGLREDKPAKSRPKSAVNKRKAARSDEKSGGKQQLENYLEAPARPVRMTSPPADTRGRRSSLIRAEPCQAIDADKRQMPVKAVVPKRAKTAKSKFNEAKRRRSSTTTATTLSSGGAGDYRSEVLSEANSEIARTVFLLTQSIETVSNRLMSVCDDFTASVQQMAQNMSSVYEAQSLSGRSMDLTAFSTPSSSHHKFDRSRGNRTELNNSKEKQGKAAIIDLAERTSNMSVFDSLDAIPEPTEHIENGSLQSNQITATIATEFDEETIESVVRSSLRDKLTKLYE